jgi:hypothetical protein
MAAQAYMDRTKVVSVVAFTEEAYLQLIEPVEGEICQMCVRIDPSRISVAIHTDTVRLAKEYAVQGRAARTCKSAHKRDGK